MTAKELIHFCPFLQCTSLFSKTMCQVVAYRGLKTIENSKTVSQKSGRGRLLEVVIYQRFQYMFWEGGHLWEVVAYMRWLHVEVLTVDAIQRSKKL